MRLNGNEPEWTIYFKNALISSELSEANNSASHLYLKKLVSIVMKDGGQT